MDERGDRRGFALKRGEKKQVRIYVEGGGDSDYGRSSNRRAFQGLLRPLREIAGAVPFEVICHGGRSQTFGAFRDARSDYPKALLVLLVDAEAGYDGAGVWRHLREVRTEDGWERPEWAGEANAYLMVPTVEAWVVKDPHALVRHCGGKLDAGKLPKRRQLEEEPKADLLQKIASATKAAKGYRKRDAFDLIGGIDLAALGVGDSRYDGLSQAARLVSDLGAAIRAYVGG